MDNGDCRTSQSEYSEAHNSRLDLPSFCVARENRKYKNVPYLTERGFSCDGCIYNTKEMIYIRFFLLRFYLGPGVRCSPFSVGSLGPVVPK